MIFSKVAERFPVMDRFLDHWPITDLIQACLKASSRKARIESEQQPVETAKPVRNVGSNRKVCNYFLCDDLAKGLG
jgi:hypothetical protein